MRNVLRLFVVCAGRFDQHHFCRSSSSPTGMSSVLVCHGTQSLESPNCSSIRAHRVGVVEDVRCHFFTISHRRNPPSPRPTSGHAHPPLLPLSHGDFRATEKCKFLLCCRGCQAPLPIFPFPHCFSLSPTTYSTIWAAHMRSRAQKNRHGNACEPLASQRQLVLSP
jgi:hypothetical protein